MFGISTECAFELTVAHTQRLVLARTFEIVYVTMVRPIAHIALNDSCDEFAVSVLVSQCPASGALICDRSVAHWNKLNLSAEHDNALLGGAFGD